MKKGKVASGNEEKTKKIFNYYLIRNLIINVVVLVLGLFLTCRAYYNLKAVEIICSVIMILTGIFAIYDSVMKGFIKFFTFNFIYGIVSISIALALIFDPLMMMDKCCLCFGLWVLVSGALKCIYSSILKNIKMDFWLILCIISSLMLLFGIILIINPFVEYYISQEVGIFMLMFEGLDLLSNIILKNNIDKIVKKI